MSNAHGWATGPGGAMTASVLGIRADLKNAPKAKASPTAFVVAPQPSGLDWCVGRLSFANHHNVDVVWNVTEAASGRERTFVLDLDLSAAHLPGLGQRRGRGAQLRRGLAKPERADDVLVFRQPGCVFFRTLPS